MLKCKVCVNGLNLVSYVLIFCVKLKNKNKKLVNFLEKEKIEL